MATFKFNKDYNDVELKRLVKANEAVDMTITRADEIVNNIQETAKGKEQFKAYSDFGYERIDNKDDEKIDKNTGAKKDKKADEKGGE